MEVRMELLQTDDYVNALQDEGQLLVAVARSAGLDDPVPSCPEWVLRDLLAHIGFVHRWATGYVKDGLTEMVKEPDEEGVLAATVPDDQLVTWVADGHAALVDALSSAPKDLQCWTFLKAPSPLTFWARRQAHETAVHRVDIQFAARTKPDAVPSLFAADGVDELLLGFLARPGSKRYTKVGPGTVSFQATDAEASWTVKVSGTGLETKRSIDPADLRVRARAEDIYLLLWGRRPSEGLDLEGEAALLDDWRGLFRITWS
jgi:uncharacterized protein (TIGR03083 family)